MSSAFFVVVLGASEQCIFSYRPRLPRKCFIARGPVVVCLDHLQHTSDDDDTDCRRRAEQHQRSHLFRCLALEKYRRAVKFELLPSRAHPREAARSRWSRPDARSPRRGGSRLAFAAASSHSRSAVRRGRPNTPCRVAPTERRAPARCLWQARSISAPTR